jgi:8-oxo-dGTP pyrophosphatase MutT (NUDIX family)
MTDNRVIRIEKLDLRFEPRPWTFALERRLEIDAHFEELKKSKPVWNGRVLVMFEHAIDGSILRGSYLETDFASFVAWRDWGFPDKSMRNCFAPAMLQGSDGGYVLGVMGQHTANAGQVYFPCGTPDPSDIREGRVDLESSARRELFEETGISADNLEVDAGWFAVLAGPRIAVMKPMRARESSEALRRRIRDHIAQDKKAELADVHIVRSPADFRPGMAPFVTAILEDRWAARANCADKS